MEKYLALQDLSEFMKTFAEASEKSASIFDSKCALAKISTKNTQQEPLGYSSDEDFIYVDSSNVILDEQDLFKEREDLNGQILTVHSQIDNILSEDEQVKLFVAQTRELLEKERGKSIAKKMNLGDTYSAKIETSVII